jgi:hypothetical protein
MVPDGSDRTGTGHRSPVVGEAGVVCRDPSGCAGGRFSIRALAARYGYGVHGGRCGRRCHRPSEATSRTAADECALRVMVLLRSTIARLRAQIQGRRLAQVRGPSWVIRRRRRAKARTAAAVCGSGHGLAVATGQHGRLKPGQLSTAGSSAKYPMPRLASGGMVLSGLRNYVHTLRAELAPKGIYARTLLIGTLLIGALIEGSEAQRVRGPWGRRPLSTTCSAMLARPDAFGRANDFGRTGDTREQLRRWHIERCTTASGCRGTVRQEASTPAVRPVPAPSHRQAPAGAPRYPPTAGMGTTRGAELFYECCRSARSMSQTALSRGRVRRCATKRSVRPVTPTPPTTRSLESRSPAATQA